MPRRSDWWRRSPAGNLPSADRLAAAKALLDVGAYMEIEALLAPTLTEPLEPAQRHAARLLLIESRLWGQIKQPIVSEAQRDHRGEPGRGAHGPGPRDCGAVARTSASSRELAQQAAEYVQQAGDLPATWKSRGELVPLLADMDQPEHAAENSAKLRAALADVPACGFRTTLLARASKALMKAAWMRIEQGDRAAALAIVWPMISDQPVPGADAALKPIKLSGGWLWSDTPPAPSPSISAPRPVGRRQAGA